MLVRDEFEAVKPMIILVVHNWKIWNSIWFSVIINDNIASKNKPVGFGQYKCTKLCFVHINLGTKQCHIWNACIVIKIAREETNILGCLTQSLLFNLSLYHNIVHGVIQWNIAIENANECCWIKLASHIHDVQLRVEITNILMVVQNTPWHVQEGVLLNFQNPKEFHIHYLTVWIRFHNTNVAPCCR